MTGVQTCALPDLRMRKTGQREIEERKEERQEERVAVEVIPPADLDGIYRGGGVGQYETARGRHQEH